MSDISKPSPLERTDSCCVSSVRRAAALLDLQPDTFREGGTLPRGWQFLLLGAETRRSDLRADGFPGFGIAMPDLGLPRLLLTNRTVEFLEDISIGARIRRVSQLRALTQKDTPSRKMAVVTFSHEIFESDQTTPAVVETQTYVLLEQAGSAKAPVSTPVAVTAEKTRTLVPDETLLFQYSALGFNSHKIHIDKAYAREVEGFPDLVVNGGLTTLFMTEFARVELGLDILRLRIKYVSPLFCNRPMTLTADRQPAHWLLGAHDDSGLLAAQMELEVR